MALFGDILRCLCTRDVWIRSLSPVDIHEASQYQILGLQIIIIIMTSVGREAPMQSVRQEAVLSPGVAEWRRQVQRRCATFGVMFFAGSSRRCPCRPAPLQAGWVPGFSLVVHASLSMGACALRRRRWSGAGIAFDGRLITWTSRLIT